jgi:PTH1 family peptidyl-tRNA hydrolase
VALFGSHKGTPADLLVVGLGNPGKEYQQTRHNVGADVVQLLADRHGGQLKLHKERALTDEVKIDSKRVALAFPQTYMNDSGVSVRALLKRYGIEDFSQLIIVHDELDLETGRIQVKLGGGTAGHNGLRSIVSHVKSEDFGRIRIGIGKPNQKGADYVLSKPGKKDFEELAGAIQQAADAVETLARTEDFAAVMNQFN